MATWTAQGAGDFGAFTGGKSTIWSTDSGVTWLGDGGADTFLLYNDAHRTDTFVLKTATALSIGTGVSDLIYATAINGAGTGTVTIGVNCTINAALTAGTDATFLINSGTPTVAINGSVTGGAGSSDSCVRMTVAGNLTVTGAVTGGGASGASGIDISTGGTGTLTVNTGPVKGSASSASGNGISCSAVATITINCNVEAQTAVGLISTSSSTHAVTLTRNIIDTATVNAVVCRSTGFAWNPAAATNYYRMRTNSTPTTLDLYYDVPDAANVRATDSTAGVPGTIATQTPSNATVSQDAGYYAAFNLATVDPDLAAANIVAGKTIFGVAGSAAGGAGGLLTHPGMAGGMRG